MKFTITLLLLALSTQATAENWLVSANETHSHEGVSKVQIELLYPLQITSPFIEIAANEFRARAKSDPSVESGDWQYIELTFDEPNRSLAQVTLEGSKFKGFTITAKFKTDIEVVETHIQDNYRRVELAALSADTLNALTSRKQDTTSQFAVEFQPSTMLTSDALPRSLLSSQLVYTNPNSRTHKRIGFFATETAANVALRAIRGRYPQARLVPVDAGEIAYAEAMSFQAKTTTASTQLAAQPAARIRAVTPSTIDDEVEQPKKVEPTFTQALDRSVLDQARAAYLEQDWAKAIGLYQQASQDPRLREEALERLGATYERSGQPDQARATFAAFQTEFPQSPNLARVQQRLASLTRRVDAPTARRSAKRENQDDWRTVAQLNQFYRRHTIEVDGSEERVPIDALFTDANLITRKSTARGYHEGRVSLGHIADFSDYDDRPDFRVHRAYWESFFKRSGLGFKLGRQSRNRSGVIGRFDGVTISHQPNGALQWNIVGGNALTSTYTDRTEDRPFYGVSVDLKLLDGKLELSPFVIEQRLDGVLDRRAVGSHFSYRSAQSQMYGAVDYDIHHKELNNLYISGSYNLNDTWRINGAADHRRFPYLTTGNALIGQRYDDLSELERDLVDISLQDLAEDRTATRSSIRLGADGKLTESWTLSLDASTAKYSSTDSSQGVFGLPERTDSTFSAQLRANDVFGSHSYTAIQVRYNESEVASGTTLNLTSRFQLFDDWQMYPRVTAYQRVYDESDFEQVRVRPALRIDYRGFRRFTLEAEIGYDWSSRETLREDIDFTGTFMRVGYRARF